MPFCPHASSKRLPSQCTSSSVVRVNGTASRKALAAPSARKLYDTVRDRSDGLWGRTDVSAIPPASVNRFWRAGRENTGAERACGHTCRHATASNMVYLVGVARCTSSCRHCSYNSCRYGILAGNLSSRDICECRPLVCICGRRI